MTLELNAHQKIHSCRKEKRTKSYRRKMKKGKSSTYLHLITDADYLQPLFVPFISSIYIWILFDSAGFLFRLYMDP